MDLTAESSKEGSVTVEPSLELVEIPVTTPPQSHQQTGSSQIVPLTPEAPAHVESEALSSVPPEISTEEGYIRPLT